MTTTTAPPSMSSANVRDPHNNNSYGTLVDRDYLRVSLPILDVDVFNEEIVRGYEEGYGEKELPADLAVAPGATGLPVLLGEIPCSFHTKTQPMTTSAPAWNSQGNL